MARYGMVVDLNRCVGCQTCTIACKHANDTVPGVQWRRVLDVETGRFPDVERLFLVVGCQHCAEPPCVPVCPTGATFQREDGLVAVDYDLCLGCGYCAVACPYQARTIVHDQRWYYGQETVQERAVEHADRQGVVQKCTFCAERVDQGLAAGLVPGIDPAATPACSSACIARAIHFGDLDDPLSNVSELSAERGWFQMHAALGTDPGIRYLYETPAVPGRDPDAGDLDDERLSEPGNPLAGERQRFWDLRAAANFTLGGMGSGLALIAWLGALAGAVSPDELFRFQVTGALLMAIGLIAVFLEIGRKRRFALVLRRPGSSWMTREVFAVAVFYPAVAASLVWPGALWPALAALAAGSFLYCQARILHAGRGIPAWRGRLMPSLLVATGLHEGMGLLALALPTHPDYVPGGAAVAIAGIVLALTNAALWRRYIGTARAAGVPPLARGVLARTTPWLHGIGHAAPAALYALAVLAGNTQTGWLLPLAGLGAVVGGALWKIAVITRACHQQGFAVERFPQRGSGQLAAPRRLEGVTARR
jgi:phenylacetyl-CoA:acceptor oxidoreductase subunit 1